MSLFRYSGLTTKVRAMSGALLSKEDFDQISTLGNVPEVVAWLKKKPSYGKVLGNENENTMHRGQAGGKGSNVPSTLIFPSCTGFPTWSREIFWIRISDATKSPV